MKLITHDGTPHADDLFAYSILSNLFPDHELIRTRDTKIIHSNEQRIVFDVGQQFDNYVYFDHHQPRSPVNEEGFTFSSFGLIWLKFGLDFMNNIGISYSDYLSYKTHDQVYKRFVRYIDIGDNGVECNDTALVKHNISIASIIHCLFDGSSDEEFKENSKIAYKILKNFIIETYEEIENKLLVEDLPYNGDGILELEKDMNMDFSFLPEDIKFVIYPRKDGSWGITNILKSPDTFIARCYLLEHLGGLSGSDLDKAYGKSGLKFVHKGLFFAIGETKEDVYTLGKLSIQIWNTSMKNAQTLIDELSDEDFKHIEEFGGTDNIMAGK